MDILTSVLLGVGLSAACGFRVFVPILFISVGAASGHLALAPGFAWLGTYPAIITFGVATLLEIAGYYIPWFDHLLDTLSTPASILAGTVVAAAMITKVDPMLKWTLAIIAGGGVAGLVQGATVVARGTSTATTAGLGNPILATIELAGSILTSLMALLLPWLTAALLLVCVILFRKKLLKAGRLVRSNERCREDSEKRGS